MKSMTAPVSWLPTATISSLVVGDRIRVAHGIFGRLGRICSAAPGHIVVRYDDGGRGIVDPTRRGIWIVDETPGCDGGD